MFSETKFTGLTKYLCLLCSLSVILCISMPGRLYAGSKVPARHRGMSYATWDRNRFSSKFSDESLQKLAEMGVDHIAIIVTLYQERHDSTSLLATDRTPSDRSVTHAIKTARKLGMRVLLKPHIDLIDKYDGTYWRADIGFNNEADWKKWFGEYRAAIVHYAKLARRTEAELFCVGTELSFTARRTDEWREIIREVREVFPGELVYAANWDDFKEVEFWDDLDYVGIDAYFPLSYYPDPSLEDLKRGWERWKNEIGSWQKNIGKPVLFTELGYPSAPHAPQSPWEGNSIGSADVDLQAKCYEAFFLTIWNQPWFAGVYWWKWDTNTRAGGKHNRRFTPQNKPAERVIEAYYRDDRRSADRLALSK